jgi:hypothetical protein
VPSPSSIEMRRERAVFDEKIKLASFVFVNGKNQPFSLGFIARSGNSSYWTAHTYACTHFSCS